MGKILAAILGALPPPQAPAKCRATNLGAYDLFVRERWLAMQSLEDTRAARPLLEKVMNPIRVLLRPCLARDESPHFG